MEYFPSKFWIKHTIYPWSTPICSCIVHTVQTGFQDTFLKEQGHLLNVDTWDCLYCIHITRTVIYQSHKEPTGRPRTQTANACAQWLRNGNKR